jgi:UDP-N-acetylmuramoyl-L-alanyl-D-glutamate--2,6-diaminopimelate ligase
VLTDPHVPGRMQVITAAEAEGDGRIPGDGQTPGVGTTESDPRAVVDYAHTPEAIRAALAALRPTTPGALVVVTGAGGDRDRDKREDMGRAAAELADIVVITDDNPRSEDPAAIRAAVRAGAETVASSRGTRADGAAVEIVEVGDRHDAIRAAVAAARADQARTGRAATVAVVGKGHESGQEVAGQVLPFDDSVEVAEALAQPAGEERR